MLILDYFEFLDFDEALVFFMADYIAAMDCLCLLDIILEKVYNLNIIINKTYLSSLIDDHSKYIVQSEFYDNQKQEIVEDTFHKAVLMAGKFDCAYLDSDVLCTV